MEVIKRAYKICKYLFIVLYEYETRLHLIDFIDNVKICFFN